MKTTITIQDDNNWSVIFKPENEAEKAIVCALAAGYNVSIESNKDTSTNDMHIQFVSKAKGTICNPVEFTKEGK